MLTSLFILIAVIAALWLGWYLRDLRETLHLFWEDARRSKPEVASEQPASSIVEPKPETPMQKAQREQEELLERLNP